MESRSSFAQLSQRGFKRRQPSSKSVAFRRPSSNDHNNDENTPLRPRPPPPAPLQSLEALLDPSPALPFPQRAGIRFADRVTPLRREVIRKAAQASEGHEERREGKRVQLDELDEPPLRRYARSPWLEKLRREVWGARREEQDPKQGSSRDHDVDGEPGPSSWEERIARGEVADHQPTPGPSALPSRRPSRLPLPSPPRTLGPNPPNSVHLAAPDPSRLSTAGLPPIRHRLRNSGTIEILPSSHEVLLDLRSRNNGVILISGDGSSVRPHYLSLLRTLTPLSHSFPTSTPEDLPTGLSSSSILPPPIPTPPSPPNTGSTTPSPRNSSPPSAPRLPSCVPPILPTLQY